MVPHSPLTSTSTRPSLEELPPTRRRGYVLPATAESEKNHYKCNDCKYNDSQKHWQNSTYTTPTRACNHDYTQLCTALGILRTGPQLYWSYRALYMVLRFDSFQGMSTSLYCTIHTIWLVGHMYVVNWHCCKLATLVPRQEVTWEARQTTAVSVSAASQHCNTTMASKNGSHCNHQAQDGQMVRAVT